MQSFPSSQKGPSPTVTASSPVDFRARSGLASASPTPPLWNRMPLTSPCLWNLFPELYPCLVLFLPHLFISFVYSSFSASGMNDFQWTVSWTFCLFTLHILLIQLFVADDSQICISSLVFLAEPNRYLQSFLGFLTLVSHSKNCNLVHYFSPFYFLSKSACPIVFPIFPLHSGCLMSILFHLHLNL